MSEYARLLGEWERDENVVGVVLGGSRGKGAYVGADSDYDVYLIVRERGDVEPYHARYGAGHGSPVEVFVHSPEGFRRHAAPGSATAWNRSTFAHVEPVLDRLDGEITRIVAAKSVVDPATAAEPLDGYVNAYYRSAKNLHRGLALESRLDAAESIPWFVEVLFAVHGRVRPYNKWLPWELREHPLGDSRWSADKLLPRLERIVSTGDLGEQQRLFRDAERLARERGLGDVVEGWQPDVAWLRGDEVRPEP